MDKGTIGALTESVALRAILTTWIMMSLARVEKPDAILTELERQAQAEIRQLSFSNLGADEIEVLRETASLHVSQFFSKISSAFRSGS